MLASGPTKCNIFSVSKKTSRLSTSTIPRRCNNALLAALLPANEAVWLSAVCCEADDFPGFVVLSSGAGTSGGAANWGCGFLPTAHQGVPFRGEGDPILNVSNPPGVDDEMQRASLDLIRDLNNHHLEDVGDPEIGARIENYELAYRMQSSAPELMDLSEESEETLALYGVKMGENSFAKNLSP